MKSITIPSKSWAFTSRSKGTVRDSLVNRLQQGMAFRVLTQGEIFLHRYKTFVADLKKIFSRGR
jgi:hypothetical protein